MTQGTRRAIAGATLFALLVSSLPTGFAFADASGPNSGSTFSGSITAPSGDVSWSNAGNAASSDNSRATVTIANSSDVSNYLRATGFGFSIPANSRIDGITVAIERSEANTQPATIFDNIVSLVKKQHRNRKQ